MIWGDLPEQKRVPPPNARRFIEDDDGGEYADVVPIPFYPNDLPVLTFEPLTPAELEYVLAEQQRMLFPVAADSFCL